MRHLQSLLAVGILGIAFSCGESKQEGLIENGPSKAGTASLGAEQFGLLSQGTRGNRENAALARAQGHIKNRKDKISHDSDHAFLVSDIVLDSRGSEHVRFDRQYKGLRVLGGDLIVHSGMDGNFENVDKAFDREIRLDTSKPIPPAQALSVAQKVFKGQQILVRPPELMVYARDTEARLAYEVVFEGVVNGEEPTELHVFVDARSAAILNQWEGVQTIAGTGKGFFTGSVALETTLASGRYQLKDPMRGNQATYNLANKTSGSGTLFLDSDNIWGNFTLADTSTLGVDAQYGAAVTWDFYLNKFQRRGIRNDGIGAASRVHYGRKYNNAFWSDSCFCMTYGDGDGTSFNPFVALDVAGHEMSHGLTSVTAKLVYSGESGGLNEATSDILGTMVEYYANNAVDTPDYLIGEKLYKTAGKALRYMHKPSLDGQSRDCYASNLGTLDVHYSSGVANHFFYLLAEGSNPTNGLPQSPTCNSSTIVGIGRDAATAIWYRALTVYMTSNTNYAGARVATLNAARDLFTEASAQYQAVAAAWSAVSVN